MIIFLGSMDYTMAVKSTLLCTVNLPCSFKKNYLRNDNIDILLHFSSEKEKRKFTYILTIKALSIVLTAASTVAKFSVTKTKDELAYLSSNVPSTAHDVVT